MFKITKTKQDLGNKVCIQLSGEKKPTAGLTVHWCLMPTYGQGQCSTPGTKLRLQWKGKALSLQDLQGCFLSSNAVFSNL